MRPLAFLALILFSAAPAVAQERREHRERPVAVDAVQAVFGPQRRHCGDPIRLWLHVGAGGSVETRGWADIKMEPRGGANEPSLSPDGYFELDLVGTAPGKGSLHPCCDQAVTATYETPVPDDLKDAVGVRVFGAHDTKVEYKFADAKGRQ